MKIIVGCSSTLVEHLCPFIKAAILDGVVGMQWKGHWPGNVNVSLLFIELIKIKQLWHCQQDRCNNEEYFLIAVYGEHLPPLLVLITFHNTNRYK